MFTRRYVPKTLKQMHSVWGKGNPFKKHYPALVNHLGEFYCNRLFELGSVSFERNGQWYYITLV